MTATALHTLFQVALLASWLPSQVSAFAGIQTFQRSATPSIQTRSRSFKPRSLGAKDDDEDDEDQREGMADAFSALDGLTANDFDDLKPLGLLANDESTGGGLDGSNMEESAKLFMEMQAELSTQGEEGMYDDIMGDLSGDNPEIGEPKSYLDTLGGDATSLGQALDEAVLSDADGIGSVDSSIGNSETPLTTADVSNDILTQEIKPSLSIEEFMNSALQEAVEEIDTSTEMSMRGEPGRTDEIAKTAEQLLEDAELRREIEDIFDRAGDKLRLEVEAMKREQEAVVQKASEQGLEYLDLEKQRISEAEESVTRLIQKVAKETEDVERAMGDLELARTQASGDSIEETALDLKKGGIIKQASLVGLLLFGSRAVTETILVVGSPYGDEHFLPAIIQAVVALACAAYFFIVK